MDFGMPTLLAFDSLAENAAFCRKLGLSFVEINMNLPMYQPPALRRDGLPRLGGVYYTMHLDENLNPFDFNPLARAAYVDTALEAADFALESGIPVLNMHIPQGVHFKLPDGKIYLFDRYWEDVRGRIEDFGRRMAEAIGNGKLVICLENTAFTQMPRVPDIMDALLKYPPFRLTYDVGHDFCDHMRALPYYESRPDALLHMHIHDANERTCHLPLGAGCADLNWPFEVGAARARRGVVETKTPEAMTASVQWLKERNLLT